MSSDGKKCEVNRNFAEFFNHLIIRFVQPDLSNQNPKPKKIKLD
jgi:hypothetical protein